jgi:hypothetical protein
MTFPVFVSAGTFASSNGAITPGLPAGYADGDLFILMVESANEAVATPSGWTADPNNGTNGIGTPGAAGATRMSVFTKWVSGTQTAPTVADSGNHTCGLIACYRYVDPNGGIVARYSGSSGSSLDLMIPAIGQHSLIDAIVVHCVADDADVSATNTGTFSEGSYANGYQVQPDKNNHRWWQTTSTQAGGGIWLSDSTVAGMNYPPIFAANMTVSDYHFANGAYILAGYYATDMLHSIFKSTDGNSFSQIYVSSNYYGFTEGIAFGSNVWIANGNHQSNLIKSYKSTDNGASWAEITAPSALNYKAWVTFDGTYFYMRGSSTTLIRSTDGVSWESFAHNIGYDVTYMKYCPILGAMIATLSSTGKVAVSTTSGRNSWNVYQTSATQNGTYVQELPTGHAIAVFGSSAQVSNNLTSWTSVGCGSSATGYGYDEESQRFIGIGANSALQPFPDMPIISPTYVSTTNRIEQVFSMNGKTFVCFSGILNKWSQSGGTGGKVTYTRTTSGAESYTSLVLKPVQLNKYTHTPSGGVTFGGVASVTYSFGVNPSGGITFSGDATENFVAAGGGTAYPYEPAGGYFFGGLADCVRIIAPFFAQGGISFSGVATALFRRQKYLDYTPEGGLSFGGISQAFQKYLFTGSGGLVFSGGASSVSGFSAIETVSLSVGITAAVTAPYTYDPNVASWLVEITINGVKIDQANIGKVSIQAGENQERVANFDYYLPAGAFLIENFHGKAVLIDYVTGAVRERLFTGVVDDFKFDLTRGSLAFTCADAFLTDLESASRAQIDAATPGAYWSPWIFDENAQGLEYFQDRLSTVPVEVHYDVYRNYESVNLFAKDVADITLTEAGLIDGSLSVQLANRLQYVNRYDLTFEYRFPVLRRQTGTITIPGVGEAGFHCLGQKAPLRTVIQDAIEQTGVKITSENYDTIPSGGVFNCGAQGGTINFLNAFFPNLVYSASIDFERRFFVTATEKYQITVRAPQSIQANGELPEQDSASGIVEFEASNWVNELIAKPVTIQLAVTDQANDGRTVANKAIETLIKKAVINIQASHRAHEINFDMPARADLSLTQTIALNAQGVNVRGKVTGFTHSFDHESGEAKTSIVLSVSKVGVAEVTETPITAPTPPGLPSFAYDIDVNVDTKVDGDASTNEAGFYTSAKPAESGKPGAVIVTIPAIAEAEVQALELARAANYDCAIIEDLFGVTMT